jgi:hypothetical protein
MARVLLTRAAWALAPLGSDRAVRRRRRSSNGTHTIGIRR